MDERMRQLVSANVLFVDPYVYMQSTIAVYADVLIQCLNADESGPPIKSHAHAYPYACGRMQLHVM